MILDAVRRRLVLRVDDAIPVPTRFDNGLVALIRTYKIAQPRAYDCDLQFGHFENRKKKSNGRVGMSRMVSGTDENNNNIFS